MKENHESRSRKRITSALDNVEKYEWLFFLVILVILIPYRFGVIEVIQIGFIDFIIAINIIALSTTAISKIRKKASQKPFVTCSNCGGIIDPPPKAKWRCKCGFELKFPPKKEE